MKKNQWALQSAYEYVKSKRSCIGPNPGFMAQLQLYENMGYTINVNNMQYKMFRLYIAAYYVRKFKTLPQSYRDVIKIDPSLLTVQLNKIAFKCKKCR